MEELQFSHVLAERLDRTPPKRKGDRTRLRLKVAAAAILDRVGYRDLRVGDICALAEIAPATFYFHFQDRVEITREVLVEFLDYLAATYGRSGPDDTFEAMRAINLYYIRIFAANAGLMRCLLQLSDDEARFREVWQERSAEHYRRVAARLERRDGRLRDLGPVLLVQVHLLGGLVDQLLRDLYVHAHPQLKQTVGAVAATPEALADLVARRWYRSLFACDPADARPDRAVVAAGDARAHGTQRTG